MELVRKLLNEVLKNEKNKPTGASQNDSNEEQTMTKREVIKVPNAPKHGENSIPGEDRKSGFLRNP